jgi:DNA-binding NtrC family response regulator
MREKSQPNYRILIVDDEPPWHVNMRKAFRQDYEFDGAESAERMWAKLEEGQFDLLLLDLKLDGTQNNTGLRLIPEVKKRYPELPVIVATVEETPSAIIAAMEAGAKGYLIKNNYQRAAWHEKFQDVIQAQQSKAIAAENKVLKQKVERLAQEEDVRYRFIGESPKILEIKTMLEGLGQEDNVTVLLTGETGTGKEVAARYLHRMGKRSGKPFVGVNLSAIQKSLLESTLFGARKGGYTGATHDIEGYFEQAQGGILLLDEIGDIDADIQIKLLRFLETRLIRAIGSDKDQELDVQVIAATHRNLSEAIKQGSFRPDLYQRLKMFVIELPPLRARREDIPLIIEHYMQLQLPNVAPYDMMATEVIDRLHEYDWPGNIRELRNAVEYMLLRQRLFHKECIDLDCLPDDVRSGSSPFAVPEAQSNPPAAPDEDVPFASKKEEDAYNDLIKIEAALRQTKGDKTRTAQLLGYKGTDHLRSRIKTCARAYRGPLDRFPLIQKYYDSVLGR